MFKQKRYDSKVNKRLSDVCQQASVQMQKQKQALSCFQQPVPFPVEDIDWRTGLLHLATLSKVRRRVLRILGYLSDMLQCSSIESKTILN